MEIKNYSKSIAFHMFLLCYISFNFNAFGEQISEIKKPKDLVEIKHARIKEKVPNDNHNWKEDPFIEITKVPQLNAVEKKRGYLLFHRPITDIVYPNTHPKPAERLTNLTGFGCRGEFEPLTFTIYPTRKLSNTKVRVSDLNNGDISIPKSAISVKLQTYWRIPYPHYLVRKYKWRWMPELLEDVTVHSSPAYECQRYWLTIHVPKDTPAGVYKGSVTLWDDGYSKAIKIPVAFRVMSFKLEKDPKKHYTSYFYDYLWEYDDSELDKNKNAWIMKASRNSYREMVDHGFDIMPNTLLKYDKINDRIYLIQADRIIKTARKAGFKNVPYILVGGGLAVEAILKKYDPTFRRQFHWKIADKNIPNEKAYKELTRLFKKLKYEWSKKGYPPLFCKPLDEVDQSAWKFGVKTLAAVKKSGLKIYTTKSPTAPDAFHYRDVVDVFCPQSYAIPYKEVVKNKGLEYWCYPNHNAWEVRIPTVMCNGGRMTYGFGNWRSGYNLLMPWSWSTARRKKDIKYFNFRMKKGKMKYVTPAGNNVDKNGNVLLTTYWECFREGYDDARYIYTLQKAITERKNSSNKKCQKLIKKGLHLLQKIWDGIHVETKYKGPETVSILPQEFDMYRWEMARITEQLIQFKKTNSDVTPSVIVNTHKRKKKQQRIIVQQQKKNNLIIKDLGNESFDYWRSVSKEATMKTTMKKHYTGRKSLRLDISVDHHVDGGGENGAYPVGWPRIRANFPKGSIDLTQYEYLNFYVWIDSNRDEVADDNTPVFLTMKSYKNKKLSVKPLGQVPQRVWIPVSLKISDIIKDKGGVAAWKSLKSMQFGISEEKYDDKTKLTFYLDNISLIRFKKPFIEKIDVASTIVLPATFLSCDLHVLGKGFIQKGDYTITLSLQNRHKKIVAKEQHDLKGCDKVAIKLDALKSGAYTLYGNISDSKTHKVISKWSKKITVIPGPTE